MDGSFQPGKERTWKRMPAFVRSYLSLTLEVFLFCFSVLRAAQELRMVA
jgi:hypothetical protein